jgi:hypothetical protein
VPNDAVLLLLIRSSLFGLHRSNAIGNYNALHSIASLPFQRANPPPKLFQIFSDLRMRRVDLSPVMTLQPKLLAKPQITPRGILRLKGFFPTEPQRILFDLMFVRGPQGRWRLFGIATDLAAPKAGAAQAAVSPPAPPPAAEQGAIQQEAQQIAPVAEQGESQQEAQQIAPAETAPAPQESGESAPPLPDRKPAVSAPVRRQSQAPVEDRVIKPVTSFEDVHDRADEADTQPKRKRIWPFRN